jgi:hypoxanthine phosphoribosyltransferase
MAEGLRCERVTWARFETLARRLAERVRAADYVPDLIVGIGRGGYLPARLLSDLLDVLNLAEVKVEHYRGTRKEKVATVRYPLRAPVTGLRVLLVDDVSDSGDTFEVAMDHVRSQGEPAELRTAVLDHKTTSRFVPDFYARKLVRWRWVVYPWAVTEDLAGLIARMAPRPATLAGIMERLERDHRLRARPWEVEAALAVLARRGEADRGER